MKKTRYVLLGLLQEEELSGYEMKKIIDVRMSFFWQESYGQIYPELNKMLEEGLIDIFDAEAAPGTKREKIRYKLTALGEQELKRWMEAENEKDSIRSECLLKMFLSTDKNREEMKKHLLIFQEQSEHKLMIFGVFDAELRKIIDLHNNHRQILAVLNLGMRQAKLYIEWCEEQLDQIGEWTKE